MRNLLVFFGILGMILIGGCAGAPNPWAQVQRPTKGKALAYGGYNAGCLTGAQSLWPTDAGYQVMRISRRRFYGHPNLIQFIKYLGQETAKNKLGNLLIGDLSQPRGGPLVGGHASHQNGLDVDIWFWQEPPHAGQLNLEEREVLAAKSMLDRPPWDIRRAKLIGHYWQDREEKILKLAASYGETDRIFVHPIIKKTLCDKYPHQIWMRKIRPWWNHHDHFHVRLKCPADNRECVPQDPLPFGHGCDESLGWWFSEEAFPAKAKEAPKAAAAPLWERVELPSPCRDLLKDSG